MYTLPGTDPVLSLNEDNTVLTFACVPVKLILVKLEVKEYPVLAVTPLVVANLSVVPLGGLTNPIVTSKVAVELNPDVEKPLTD
jgi:hypothetical protein